MSSDSTPGTSKLKKLIIAAAIMGAIGVALLLAFDIDVKTLKGLFDKTLTFLGEHPSLIFWAIVILPGVGFPVSALLIAAGGVYGQKYGTPTAALLCIAAISMNIIWTYLLARGPARHLLEKIIASTGHSLPVIMEKNYLRIAVIARVTPGIPLFVQNYLLGLANIPFKIYCLVSIGFQALWTTGFVVFGEAALDGNVMLVVGAVGILVAAALGTKVIKVRMEARKKAEESKS